MAQFTAHSSPARPTRGSPSSERRTATASERRTATMPRATVRLWPPLPHGVGRRLASSSFPLPQSAPPPLPFPGNWLLNSLPLNRTSTDCSSPHRSSPLLPRAYIRQPPCLHISTPRPQLSSPRASRTPSAAAELRSPPPLAHLAASLPKVSPPLGFPCRPLAFGASTKSHRAPEQPLD
jgi:hypothetical protein